MINGEKCENQSSNFSGGVLLGSAHCDKHDFSKRSRQAYDGAPVSDSSRQVGANNSKNSRWFFSMDWFVGEILTGNHGFYHQI